MSAPALHANPVTPFRFFHVDYFLRDFFFDGHQRLIVARTFNEARQAANVNGPEKGLDTYIEELQEEEFEELCGLYERIDRDRKWIVAVN